MRATILTATAVLMPAWVMAWAPQRTDNTLWYNQPAQQWEETVPLGNGRLGMMPDGGIDREKVVLNEISMWSGSEADYGNPKAAECLPEIQQLLIEGRDKEAQDLMYSSFVPSKPEEGGTYGSYQMLADLDITYTYSAPHQTATGYHRWLDLSEAAAYTSFTLGDVTYLREYYVPRGQDVMIMHITADKPEAVSLAMTLHRAERAETVACADDMLTISGTLDSGKEDADGIRYHATARAIAAGQTAGMTNDGNTIAISHADEAWIVINATTDYWQRLGIDSEALAPDLTTLTAQSLHGYKRTGICAHRELYGRAGINLPQSETSALPTDRRILAYSQGEDPELAALYYNYGRYLLICSTRPGYLPPNLQGLWANECGTPWNGDYHTNINVQMNHWPVEQGNLTELHEPLIRLVERAVPSGRRTARTFYGNKAQGWVMHMMTNVWDYTEPGEHPSWGATNTGGAWLCAHLWEHHLYNPADTAYLREIYPILKGASQFFLSTMITEPRHGWLVTAPSSSPENEFYMPGTDDKVSICMGPTMDTQLVRELLCNVITAAETLKTDADYTAQLKEAIAKLPPMQTGSDGRLMEWLQEYQEADIHHRHVSHLYGLHPGNQISLTGTPELAEACRKALDTRGDAGTGWSRAWKINFWARLGDGDRANKLLHALLAPSYTDDSPKHGPGTFPNLFCSHPPFQMDGNWGGTSGISEMLVQSQDGHISLLPALPSAWPEGSLYGFKVRGGATVNMTWYDGLPVTAEIDSPTPQTLHVPQGVRGASVNGARADIIDGFIMVPAGNTICIFDQ